MDVMNRVADDGPPSERLTEPCDESRNFNVAAYATKNKILCGVSCTVSAGEDGWGSGLQPSSSVIQVLGVRRAVGALAGSALLLVRALARRLALGDSCCHGGVSTTTTVPYAGGRRLYIGGIGSAGVGAPAWCEVLTRAGVTDLSTTQGLDTVMASTTARAMGVRC